ncbi:outer membrane beta-barrel protein [Enterovibrio baiacu]|uniref:outer membrane beta-barrel protein n=1 Tax=Enterovibrio baiacu TaxID=2491023 RepID=UPI001012C937|nr:outer membrane beta-barrel protein [Enterovibrio baiacu]MBE1277797.1 porin family protein [Enterovibrio baiacu]
MKKSLIALLLFSTHSYADNHFYAGGNLSIFNDMELKYSGMSADKNSDMGGSAFAGYSFTVSPGLELGLEVEYLYFGKTDFTSSSHVDADAYYINAKPKFVEEGNNLYSALILGVGSMSSEISVSGQSIKDSDLSYQAGFEIGYMIDNLDIGVGYRYQTAEFDGFDGADVSNQSVTLGIRYNFR